MKMMRETTVTAAGTVKRTLMEVMEDGEPSLSSWQYFDERYYT